MTERAQPVDGEEDVDNRQRQEPYRLVQQQ